MLKIEKRVFDFFEKHIYIICALIATLLALYVRYKMMPFISKDYDNFLRVWFDYLKDNGGLFALKSYPGDYNAPYMTIMAILTYLPVKSLYSLKSLSIVFDFVLAISGSLLVNEITKKKESGIIAYILLLFIPSVVMNSSMWCQCDVIYTSFLLLSLLSLIKKKHTLSFIMLGISFAFKLQFVFILPLYILYYIREKNISILHFFIIPTVNLILCLPAIIFGKPIKDVLLIYLRQTSEYSDSLSLAFPNIYNLTRLTGEHVGMLYKLGLAITIASFMLLAIYYIKNKIKFDNEKILLTAVLVIIIATYLLPGMHERYLYAGEVLMVIYYYIYRKNLPMLITILVAPIVTYSNFLFGQSFDYMPYLSIAYLIVITIFTKNTLIELKK